VRRWSGLLREPSAELYAAVFSTVDRPLLTKTAREEQVRRAPRETQGPARAPGRCGAGYEGDVDAG
jgi:hypothetical protein